DAPDRVRDVLLALIGDGASIQRRHAGSFPPRGLRRERRSLKGDGVQPSLFCSDDFHFLAR
ncbi:hypothetical protein M3765_24525, partial [Streptomyces thermoviolaceus]|nr:hypothetical protein [Streptomyces thermoviolaceus]